MFYTSAYLKRRTDRKNKPWQGALKYKDPETGEWQEVRKSFSDIEKRCDAQVALNKWRAEEEEKAQLINYGKRMSTAIKGYLDDQLALNQISIVTYQNSMRLAENSIFPLIGNLIFADATKFEIQELVNNLAKQYKPQTTRTIFAIVSKTYKDALRTGEVLRDPTKNVQLPRVIKDRINYLDENGRRKFIALVNEDCSFYLASMIAYYTGMRAGEICALQWNDIIFATNTIHVRNNAKEYKDKDGVIQIEISHPKTFKSRTIPLLPQLKTILLKVEEEKNPKAKDYVIDQRKPRLLCSNFQKWAQRQGLIGEAGKAITMHGLRHTFATLGVQSGMDIKSLSSILGHANTAMTLDTYASDDEQAKHLAMNSLNRLFEEQEGNDF